MFAASLLTYKCAPSCLVVLFDDYVSESCEEVESKGEDTVPRFQCDRIRPSFLVFYGRRRNRLGVRNVSKYGSKNRRSSVTSHRTDVGHDITTIPYFLLDHELARAYTRNTNSHT